MSTRHLAMKTPERERSDVCCYRAHEPPVQRTNVGMMTLTDTPAVVQRRGRVLADLPPGALVRDVAPVVGSAALVGGLAQITMHLAFTPVPITGQTLGVLLVGTALGWRAGLALVLYAIAGVAGVPWFAGHRAGYASASFGYVISRLAPRPGTR